MVSIDFSKYENDGWGLSKKEFELLYDILKSKQTLEPEKEINIVEFGSGRSTEFLVDLINIENMNIKIYSFDDSLEYAFKGKHDNLKLHIVPLVECSDESWTTMFKEKKYSPILMSTKLSPVHTRQHNTFYSVTDEMLPENIDVLIVDGPHGNGRSLAYLRCHKQLTDNAIILIDDASHYPFYDHLILLCDTNVLYEQHVRENKWINGGDFIISEIKK